MLNFLQIYVLWLINWEHANPNWNSLLWLGQREQQLKQVISCGFLLYAVWCEVHVGTVPRGKQWHLLLLFADGHLFPWNFQVLEVLVNFSLLSDLCKAIFEFESRWWITIQTQLNHMGLSFSGNWAEGKKLFKAFEQQQQLCWSTAYIPCFSRVKACPFPSATCKLIQS